MKNDSNQRLDASYTDKEFAMQLAHEMRTSLISASYIFQDLLRKYSITLSPSDRKLLQVGIETNAIKIAYAGEFLERMHGVPITTERQIFSLGSFRNMLEHLIQAYEARAQEKGIALIVNTETDDSVEADFNKTRMYSVIEILLDNAIKYSLRDIRKISVTLENDSRSLFITVSDTGIGIPEEERGRIFERFFRASNAREENIQEGGVGLHLCMQYLSAEGGTIRFESEKDEGTTFFVSVPLIRRKFSIE